MTVAEEIERYNELTDMWLTGCEWLSDPSRTPDEIVRGEARLVERLDELSKLYTKLRSYGIKVVAEEKLKTTRKGDKK